MAFLVTRVSNGSSLLAFKGGWYIPLETGVQVSWKREAVAMSAREDLDRQFRSLHSQSITEFEETMRTRHEENERLVAEQKPLEREEFARVARILDVPIEQIERSRSAQEKKLKNRIAEIQQSLQGKAHPESVKVKLALHPALSIPGARSVPILATNIMSTNQADIIGIQGQHGNPWVLPHDPGRIRIKQEHVSNEYGL